MKGNEKNTPNRLEFCTLQLHPAPLHNKGDSRMPSELFDRHRGLLELALAATATRSAFSAYPDRIADFNEVVQAEGREAFDNYCGSYFYLDQPGVGERVGNEESPYRIELGIQYPKTNLSAIMPAAVRAREAWSKVDVDSRTGMCMEILYQLHLRSFEIGYATMHTTGQPFAMAFQSGGPHAQERGLEAVAMAYQEMRSIPAEVIWEKDRRTQYAVRVKKTFRVTGRGVGHGGWVRDVSELECLPRHLCQFDDRQFSHCETASAGDFAAGHYGGGGAPLSERSWL